MYLIHKTSGKLHLRKKNTELLALFHFSDINDLKTSLPSNKELTLGEINQMVSSLSRYHVSGTRVLPCL